MLLPLLYDFIFFYLLIRSLYHDRLKKAGSAFNYLFESLVVDDFDRIFVEGCTASCDGSSAVVSSPDANGERTFPFDSLNPFNFHFDFELVYIKSGFDSFH